MSMPAARQPREPLVPPGGVDLHARDMTATFAAEVTLRAAQDRLRELNQWLPVDGDPDTALGTLVERNSTGPLRLGYGAWRDLLLGVQFTNGRGELITAGGRTVKNVAGYDLTKFMVGQHGVFGRLVTVTTRTYRRPDVALLARFDFDARCLGRLLPTPRRPQWSLVTPGPQGSFTPGPLLCGYLGDRAAIEYYRAALGSAEPRPVEVVERSLDDDIAHRAAAWRSTDDDSFRASVPPARLSEFVAKARLNAWAADAAFGIVVGPFAGPENFAMEDAAHAVGGSVYFRCLPTAHFQYNAVAQRLLSRLKAAIDPDDRLIPLPIE